MQNVQQKTNMPSTLLRLVLLISCAHALVHMYELSLPGVEQQIAAEYFPEDVEKGKEVSGMLSMTWRLPWGIGALFAGLMVDRFGAKRLLLVYLYGVSAVCVVVGFTHPLAFLFVAMFSMGLLASIYHPAGLTWISHRTDESQRPFALGIHGILGSLGISSGPLLAATITGWGFSWREFYLWLALPGIVLATALAIYRDRYREADTEERDNARKERAQRSRRDQTGEGAKSNERAPADTNDADTNDADTNNADTNNADTNNADTNNADTNNADTIDTNTNDAEQADWRAFGVLTLVAVCQGVIYSGVLSFLPRYMAGWETTGSVSNEGYLATGVLILGCIGQYTAGYFARPDRLERQLCWISLANAPFLLFMSLAANDGQRLMAAGAFSIVHFMHQPIYNSLIATYSPRSRRSFAYGISIAMGLGLGSCGAAFTGYAHQQFAAFASLAVVALVGSAIAARLARMRQASVD